jgi:hypothetical protein
MRAKITGTYPGTIFHIVDPGFAEIFIAEWRKPGTEFCAEHLVHWTDRVMIPDFGHKEVALYINGKQRLLVKVLGALPERKAVVEEWIVTALVGSSKDGPFFSCALHHKDDIILGIYQRVFGPSNKAACEDFIKKHCSPISA